MFIKRLEIFGFKSFKERTLLEFENQDITGVVGPNGCGKSNIVDALLWVMGENAPKNLRGETLSDVIFGGTSKEASGKLAEVKLTLNPGTDGFPVNYEKFSEIMITRRSYRDGVSEFFINDKECLLRDIREFFMNTGAGCRGFSIIEQESIERLITAKPLQRRYIIEEAAGITKFKNHKAESLRKLQLVDHNLKRLDDMLKIQANQLSHLKSQAKKAEKYKKLKQEIELRDKELSGSQYQSFIEDQKKIQLEIKNKIEQKKEDTKSLQDKKEEILNWTQQIQTNQLEIDRLKQEYSEKKIEEASLKDKAKTFKMIEEIEQKLKQIQLEKKEVQKKLIAVKEFFKTNYSLNDIQTEVLKVKTKIDEIKQNKNSLQVHIDLLTKQVDFVKKEKSFLSAEEERFKESVKKSIHRKNQIKEELKKEKNNQLLTEENFIRLNQTEKDLRVKKENLEKERNQLRAKTSGLSHKVEELKKLLTQVSKMNQPAGELLQWKPEQFHLLFEKLDVEPEYTRALSVVLGSLEQAVVPDELIDLEQGIEKLKEAQKGKSWFLSRLPQEECSSSAREKLKTFPAFICFLDEKVKWNVFNSPLKILLQKTAVVSDLKSAFELKKEFPKFQFVTKSADFINENSMVYAGSENQKSSLLEIQTQVEESVRNLSIEKTKLKAKEIEWDNCLQQLEGTEINRKKQEKKLSNVSDSFKSLEKELEFLEKDLVRISESRDKNKDKIRDFQEKQDNLQEHTTVFSEDIGKQEQLVSSKLSYLNLLNLALEKAKSEKVLEKESNLLLNVISPSNSSKNLLSSSELKKKIEKNQEEKNSLEYELDSLQKQQEEAYHQETQVESDRKALEQNLFQEELNIKSLTSEEEKKEIEKSHIKEKFKESHHSNIEDFKPSADISLETLKEEMSYFKSSWRKLKKLTF